MFDYFQNKFRIDSHRLKGWDYRTPGWYFITICTFEKICCFGEIRDATICLTDIGSIVWKHWQKLPKHHPYVQLGEFIVMPNHVHMTIRLTSNNDSVETLHATSLPQNHSTNFMSIISPKAGSLSTIIRSFKSGVTRWAHMNNHGDFAWQPNFHDHIIRNSKSLQNIDKYIRSNPEFWVDDKYHPQNKK